MDHEMRVFHPYKAGVTSMETENLNFHGGKKKE